ncbi:DUF29 domain-containing protein [soil metagenome]
MMTQTLYKKDFYAWTKQQASLLQTEDFAEVDLPNLIEEIEAMGRSQKHQLTNRLRVLLMHLLKLAYQTNYPTNSWLRTIREQRRRLELLLEDSPSLRYELLDTIAYAYPRSRADASEETGLSITFFPDTCPYTIEQILDVHWLPG